MPLDRITIVCFGASYAVALGLELVQLFWPRAIQRVACALFGAAGLLAHTLYLFVQHPTLASQFGSLLFLAWILSVFYLSESIHYRQQSRGVFVLPVVLALTLWAGKIGPSAAKVQSAGEADASPEVLIWGYLHAGLLVLAAVGICVGFVASVMYLVQTRQLREKVVRSEEHTSELQSRFDLVCRLLLEKKKENKRTHLNSSSVSISYY